jgi:hypothetical protein
MRSWIYQNVFSALTGLLVVACTANAPANGVCKKSCGSRPIGGGNIKVLPLSKDLTISNCKAGVTLPSQIFRYFVYQDMSQANSGSKTDGKSESGSLATANRLPAAGIAFTPQIQGYLTVTTDSSEWCTDSCGVAEVEFSATCNEQDVQIGLLVPGMLYDDNAVASTRFTVKQE